MSKVDFFLFYLNSKCKVFHSEPNWYEHYGICSHILALYKIWNLLSWKGYLVMPENNFTFHIWLLECIVRMNAYIEMSSIQCNFRYTSCLYFCQDILLVPGHICMVRIPGLVTCMDNIPHCKLHTVYYLFAPCTSHTGCLFIL